MAQRQIRVADATAISQAVARIEEFKEPGKGLPVVLLRGIAQYPRLDEPDTKFAKPGTKGEYNCKVKYSAEAVASMVEFLEPLMAASREMAEDVVRKQAKSPALAKKAISELKAGDFFTAVIDPDTAEDTGEGTRTFSKPASFIDKKKGDKMVDLPPPAIFDSKGQPMKEHVGGGSEVIPSVVLQPYFVAGTNTYGVRSKFLALQVVQLRAGRAAADAEGFGFDMVEDGYETSGEGSPDPASSGEDSDRDPTAF